MASMLIRPLLDEVVLGLTGRYCGPAATSIARLGHSGRTGKLTLMNPRYRRLVIPGALVALILIVAVSAVARG